MNSIYKKEFWLKKWDWIIIHRKLLLIITGCVIVVTAIITTVILLQPKKIVAKTSAPTTVKPTKEVTPVKYYSPLTGVQVTSKVISEQAVTGIMIENSPEARPQSGLKDSGVVFEAIAEGGITRFLVLYQTEKPQMIGPVRSVRLYDLDWLAAFNSSLCHVGGSAAALTEVRNGNYRDLDQFFNSNTYWRSTDRYAPHNVYTNFANIDALNTAKGYMTSTFTGFTHTDGAPVATPDAANIDVTISSALFNSYYVYNKEANNYARYQAGKAHLDRESGQITPSVVIALKVNEVTIMEDGYRQSIETIGEGSAVIFQNGTTINATWHKTSKTSQMTFTDTDGKDIPLVRGQTWITAIPNDGGDVTWK